MVASAPTSNRRCECSGFEDCWSNSREEHFTRTIHEPDCPQHPENQAFDRADHDRDVERDERAMREAGAL